MEKFSREKKLAFIVLTVMLFSIFPFSLQAAEQIKGAEQIVTFSIGQQSYQKGNTTVTTDVTPYIKDGRTMVPVAFVSPALGTDKAVWLPESRTVRITKGNSLIIIKIGSKELIVNDNVIIMDTVAEIKDIGNGGGRTMLPISFIAKALNVNYQWNKNTRSVDFYGYEETYAIKGTYGPDQGIETIAGNVTIETEEVRLQNKVIKGNLIIAESVGDGDVYLDNITVEGNTFVRGGGQNSIHIDGGSFQGNVVIENTPAGGTRVVVTNVQGVNVVVATADKGEEVILEGSFSNVEISATDAVVSTQGQTTIDNIVVNSTATVTVAEGATIGNVTLNNAATVTGEGTINTANVNADDVVISTTSQPTVITAEDVAPPTTQTSTPSQNTSSSSSDSGGSDTIAPNVSTFNPADNATSVAINTDLVLTFNENVQAVAGKNIVIKKTSDNSTVATIPANDAQVTVSGATVTINPANDFLVGTEYYVQIASGAFADASNNSYAGISDTTSWSFTTLSPTGSLSYGEGLFIEVPANNGAIDSPLEITLSGDTFTGALNDNFIADGKAIVSDIPGITAEVRRKTATTVWLVLTGNATNHAEANDISNLIITFQDSAFTGGNAAIITNATKNDLRVDFHDPAVTSIADFSNTTKTDTTATFTWTAAVGANAVKIQQMHPGDVIWTDSTTGPLATDATTATVIGLTESTDYVFRLIVTGGDNAGISSGATNVTTEAAGAVASDLITSITGTSVHAAGDTIVIDFSEDLNQASTENPANWTIKYADDNSGTNPVNITTSNATFAYSAASDQLTVTLDEATDQMFIPHNKYLSVVPANTNVQNVDGSKYIDNTSVKYSTAVGKESTSPSIVSALSKTNSTTFTVTYNEVLNRTVATNTANWQFTDDNNGGTTISNVALSADGLTVTISLSNEIEGYDEISGPQPIVTDLAGNPATGSSYTETAIRLSSNEVWVSGGPGAIQGHFEHALGIENNYSVTYNDVNGTYWNGGAGVNIKTARGSDYTNAINMAKSVADVGDTANASLKVFFIETSGNIDNLTDFIVTPCQIVNIMGQDAPQNSNPRDTLYFLGQRASGTAVNAIIKLYVRDTENNVEKFTYLTIKSATDTNGNPTGIDIIGNPYLSTGNQSASIIGAYNYAGAAEGCTVNLGIFDRDGTSILTPTLDNRIKIRLGGSEGAIINSANYTIDEANDTITFTKAYLDANFAGLAANDDSTASQQFYIEYFETDDTSGAAFAAQIVDIY